MKKMNIEYRVLNNECRNKKHNEKRTAGFSRKLIQEFVNDLKK